MKQLLFIDTWGWVVLYNKREPRHSHVKTYYRQFRNSGGLVFTTDYVLDETFTLLFRRLPFDQAKEAVDILDDAIKQGYLKMEWVSHQRFEKAKDYRLKYQDKPGISFTDLTTITVMKELGLTSIITDDDHFLYVGMGFEKIPSE
jgi:uncharacterized protein